MTQRCFNRPAFTDPNAGWFDTGRVRERWFTRWGQDGLTREVFPIFRYRHPWFTDRCTVHDKADIGPNQTYAEFHNWQCAGCRWHPTEATS